MYKQKIGISIGNDHDISMEKRLQIIKNAGFDAISPVWDYNISRLQKSRYMPTLNFELKVSSKPDRHENDIYMQMSPEQYFTEAYKRACKIAYRYSKDLSL